jgi:hypothetical protein
MCATGGALPCELTVTPQPGDLKQPATKITAVVTSTISKRAPATIADEG